MASQVASPSLERGGEAAAQLASAWEEVARLRRGISRLSKAAPVELQLPPLPPLPVCPPCDDEKDSSSSSSSSSLTAAAAVLHARCLAGVRAAEDGYRRAKGHMGKRKRPRVVLTSSFDQDRTSRGGAKKIQVDKMLADHALAVFGKGFVDDVFGTNQQLVFLLLDAPNTATTQALVEAFPSLARFAHRICIPQADPEHYARMVNTASALHLNVRCQRLDQWLCSNVDAGMRVPIFFADYETTVYGKPAYNFQPLVDVQRFLRSGYVPREFGGCLLGLTLSFRAPLAHFYDGPELTPEDVAGFVAHEAGLQGLACECRVTFRYGMTFQLFRLWER